MQDVMKEMVMEHIVAIPCDSLLTARASSKSMGATQTFKLDRHSVEELGDLKQTEKQECTGGLPITTSMRSDSDDVDGNDDDEASSGECCAVCLDEFEDGDEICSSRNKNCKHLFHRVCIYYWLLKNDNCPCCRRNYLSFDHDLQDGVVDDIEVGRSSPLSPSPVATTCLSAPASALAACLDGESRLEV